MTRLERAKDIIGRDFKLFPCGIFDCRNMCGDTMVTRYEDDEITIDVCPSWNYFEVFGLTDEEFHELKRFYEFLLED